MRSGEERLCPGSRESCSGVPGGGAERISALDMALHVIRAVPREVLVVHVGVAET